MEHNIHEHHSSHADALTTKLVSENTDQQNLQLKAARVLALGLVIASLILAGGIYMASKLIVNSLERGGGIANSKVIAPVTGQAPSPAPVAPADSVSVTDREGQPTLGSSNAPVTIVEFADFQCPYCQRYFQTTAPEIKSKYIDTGKVKLVYRHFPLSIHQNAEVSAVASECARVQGKFWEYHDLLFKDGQADGAGLDKDSLKKYADSLGLNKGTLGIGANKFNKCLDSSETLAAVQADQAEGLKDGVSGTPTFFINGKRLVGSQPTAQFEQLIEEALKK